METSTYKKKKPLVDTGDYVSLPKRGIHEETCKKFGYSKSSYNDSCVQVAAYHDDSGRVVGQKLRFPDKRFMVTGDVSNRLFGQKLWKSSGKRLVITEGEIDCLSYAQVTKTWPVVSVPNGAAAAKKAITQNIEWIEAWDQVVFAFDNDDAGRKAAKECAEILTPGKAAIATLPSGYKDFNDMLLDHKVKEMQVAVWEAQTVRPDGIVNGEDLWDAVSTPVEMGTPYPWSGLNDKLFGLRGGEIVTLTAGTGIGKSTMCAEIGYHLGNTLGENVGYVALEENNGRSGLRFMSIALDKPIHLPGIEVSPEDRAKAFADTLGTGNYFFYDHFGSMDSTNLLNKLRFLVKGMDCKWLILDHLSIVVSGMDLEDDERRALDRTMTALRSFTEETGCGLLLVSHLRRISQSKSHERGAEVDLGHLRGSQAIAQLSDAVVAVERDQQDETDSNVLTVRVLKNRYAGMTGVACTLSYDADTGRLKECTTDFDRQLPGEDDDQQDF